MSGNDEGSIGGEGGVGTIPGAFAGVTVLGCLLLSCSHQEEPLGGALRWRQNEVVVLVVGAPDGEWPTDAELTKSLERTVDTWKKVCGGCPLPSFRFVNDPARRGARADGVNVVRVEMGHWCADQKESALAPCGPDEVIARTELYPLDVSQGRGIREADMKIHGRDPRLSDKGAARTLDAVVLHEMGHFLGLVHTDGDEGVMSPVPLDPERPLRLDPTVAEGARLRSMY